MTPLTPAEVAQDPFAGPLPDFRGTRWHRFKWWLRQTLCGLWGHKEFHNGYCVPDFYFGGYDADEWWECSRCGKMLYP